MSRKNAHGPAGPLIRYLIVRRMRISGMTAIPRTLRFRPFLTRDPIEDELPMDVVPLKSLLEVVSQLLGLRRILTILGHLLDQTPLLGQGFSPSALCRSAWARSSRSLLARCRSCIG